VSVKACHSSGWHASLALLNLVCLLRIPMRSEYAKRTKEKLWVNKVDMVENIERNLIEYAYESYSPVRVCEENDMYLCTVTQGEPSLLSLFNIVYLHATNLV